jgi:hypothetical protein
MFTLPFITFYSTQMYCRHLNTVAAVAAAAVNSSINTSHIISKDNIDSYSGLAAIVMTNIIIAIYCYQAYFEDSGMKTNNTTNDDKLNNNNNDDDHPRVGAFKQRTD